MKKGPVAVPIVLILIPLICLGYYFPVQRYLAHREFKQYIIAQGISIGNIETKKVLKDYKIGGYNIMVTYKDDPEFTYEYSYVPSREMICIIFDEYNTSTDITNKKTKYRSLE